MKEETARQILNSLLAEKNISIPMPEGEDKEKHTRRLLEYVLSPEASGALPEETARALAETFDAVAVAMETAAPVNDNTEKT